MIPGSQVSILCVQDDSNYYSLPGNLDLWPRRRDAYNFKGNNPVITHAPCQQWSRLKGFAKENKLEKDLAFFCLDQVNTNGGIFEHPAGSSFFEVAGIPKSKIYSVDQFWWGFPARKRTYLYFHGFRPVAYPLNFNAIEYCVGNSRSISLPEMKKSERSKMTYSFCAWLVSCIR